MRSVIAVETPAHSAPGAVAPAPKERKDPICVCGHIDMRHSGLCAGCYDCECHQFWKRKSVAGGPTQRSMATMHNRRYLCQVVEHWVPQVKVRRDLFGFIDVLCVKGEEIIGVQATSGDHVAHRVTKIIEHENYPAVIAAIRIVVHGWRKNSKNRWVLREVEL
jgi:hypothetical protein